MDRFRHEAVLYDGKPGFLEATLPFILDGLRSAEQVLVAVDQTKIGLIRSLLDDDPGLRFIDMAALGRNPARIIPAWRAFVAQQPTGGRGFRGIGEPIWAQITFFPPR